MAKGGYITLRPVPPLPAWTTSTRARVPEMRQSCRCRVFLHARTMTSSPTLQSYRRRRRPRRPRHDLAHHSGYHRHTLIMDLTRGGSGTSSRPTSPSPTFDIVITSARTCRAVSYDIDPLPPYLRCVLTINPSCDRCYWRAHYQLMDCLE
jgi:hypothetical protein